MTLIDHFEQFLGPIQDGWSKTASGVALPFQVVRFARGPTQDTVTFATLGLSRSTLHPPSSGKVIRQELVMLVPERERDAPIPGLLQEVAEDIRNSGHAALRGDVIGPRGPISPGATTEALYVSLPIYFPAEFAMYRDNGVENVIAWLIPITSAESKFVRDAGWEAFEERLDQGNVDLTDMKRRSAI